MRPFVISISRLLACALSAWIVTGCAGRSMPTPLAPEVRMPAPPVSTAPPYSEAYLPKALNYSWRVESWLQRVDSLTTGAPLK